MSQAELAKRIHVHPDLIAKIEKATRWPTERLAISCDEVLSTGGTLAALWPAVARERPQNRAPRTSDRAGSRALALGPLPAGGWPVEPPGEPTPPLDIDALNETGPVTAMHAFRAADRQVGGGHLYATVIRYLHTEVAPRLFGSVSEGDGRASFAAAAALTEMGGWMAHDACRDGAAGRHLHRSLDLARAGGQRHLGVQVLASLSHLANHLGRANDAVRYARQGHDLLTNKSKQPELEARLLAMQARGFATLHRPKECVELLRRAETALSGTPDEQPSPWSTRFDEGSLASEAARCLRQLGDLAEAQRQAERIIAMRRADRTRSRAFGQLILATVLIARGQPDEACAAAQEVLDTTRQLGSGQVAQQLLDLQRQLAPYRGSTTTNDFLVRLAAGLRERTWLYHWSADGRSEYAVRTEEA